MNSIGGLCGVPLNEISQEHTLIQSGYPNVNLSSDTVNPSGLLSYRNIIVPVDENPVKRIVRTYFENGWHAALEEARQPATRDSAPIIASAAEYFCQAMCYINCWKYKLMPHLEVQNEESIAKFSETRDWQNSHIRYIAWHPDYFKMAVAGRNDVIRIYTNEPNRPVVPLRNFLQKWITCMAWRPNTPGELAVGCDQGICIWLMDHGNLNITRLSPQIAFLKHPKKQPITSIQWNMNGTLLASASIGDPDVLLWNVDKSQSAPLIRFGPGCSLLKWSPNGTSLFSATVKNVFRVWSVDQLWTPERWTIKNGNIQSACWSACGNFLIFITTEESILYYLHFSEEHLLFRINSVPKQASPIADLSKVCYEENEIGGQPQALAWDADGRYLAIIFKDSPCVAIFTTCIQKFGLTAGPGGFISSDIDAAEYPVFICFQSKNLKYNDTILTIGWSSGRIQYYPFINM